MATAVRRWPAFLIALVAGWCAAGTVPAAPVPAAQAVALAGSAGCPAAEMIGVHGTGEGPSTTDGHDSPEIKATFSAFTADERKLGEYGAQLDYYPYPTASFADYLPTNWPELATTIRDYASELGAALESFTSACPATPISLVGYSLGALLINNMLSSYHSEWSYIDAVELYGDPCWYNPRRDYRGLAQYAAKLGFRLGCFPGTHTPTRWCPRSARTSWCKACATRVTRYAERTGRRTRSPDRSSPRHCALCTRARTAPISAPPPATAPSFWPRTLLSLWAGPVKEESWREHLRQDASCPGSGSSWPRWAALTPGSWQRRRWTRPR